MDAAAWPVWVLTEGAPAKYLGARLVLNECVDAWMWKCKIEKVLR